MQKKLLYFGNNMWSPLKEAAAITASANSAVIEREEKKKNANVQNRYRAWRYKPPTKCIQTTRPRAFVSFHTPNTSSVSNTMRLEWVGGECGCVPLLYRGIRCTTRTWYTTSFPLLPSKSSRDHSKHILQERVKFRHTLDFQKPINTHSSHFLQHPCPETLAPLPCQKKFLQKSHITNPTTDHPPLHTFSLSGEPRPPATP